MLAVRDADLRMVQILLSKARVDPSYKNSQAETALEYLDPISADADQIRDSIKDAIDMESIFQNVD